MNDQPKPTHHNTCPKGERCACYLTGYTDSEYDYGHALSSLDDQPTYSKPLPYPPLEGWTTKHPATDLMIEVVTKGNYDELRKQLAINARFEKLYHATLIVADEQAKQLAAERERANAAELEVGERERTIIHYKQQLAAKVKEK